MEEVAGKCEMEALLRVYSDLDSFNKTREEIHLVASASELGVHKLVGLQGLVTIRMR